MTSVRIFIHFINSIEVSGAEVIEVSGARAIEISGASEVFGAMESVAPRHFKLLFLKIFAKDMAPEGGSRGIISVILSRSQGVAPRHY